MEIDVKLSKSKSLVLLCIDDEVYPLTANEATRIYELLRKEIYNINAVRDGQPECRRSALGVEPKCRCQFCLTDYTLEALFYSAVAKR